MQVLLSHHPLARDIAAVIAIKIVIIALASTFLFPASQRPPVDADIIAHKLFAFGTSVERSAPHGH